MKMAGILLIYILGIYFLLTKMVQLEDEAVVGVKKTHKELSENTHSSNEKAIQYVASNMIKEAPKIAITFDDGPSPAWTPKLLDGLKERNRLFFPIHLSSLHLLIEFRKRSKRIFHDQFFIHFF